MTPDTIERRLVARLMQRLRPGMIGLGLARRITGAVDAIAGRLPLLARFPRVVERQGTVPATTIVHALWPAAPSDDRDAARSGVDHAARPALPIVAARTTQHEPAIAPTAILPAAIASIAVAAPAAPHTAPMAPMANPLDAPVRRSRMGAPLAPTAPAAAATPGGHGSGNPASAAAARTPDTRGSGAPGPTSIVHARPVAAGAPARATASQRRASSELSGPPATAAPRSVAPHRTGSPRLMHPVVVANAAPTVPIPIAAPPLAHVAASPPAARLAAPAIAQPPAPPAPIAARALAAPAPPSQPRAGITAPRSLGAPLVRADLPEIAARVQHILARQAAHERARRGLRR